MAPKKNPRAREQASVPVPPTYPGLLDGRGMAEEAWKGCRDILESVYTATDGSRDVSGIFQELPDRDEFPDYYEAIPEPECLDHISAQLASQAYAKPEDFFKQLHLVFLNAKHYNEQGSTVYTDAQSLEEQVLRDWTAKASAQVFSHTDPYHNSPVKPRRGRPPGRRGGSTAPVKSSTPAPVAETQRYLSPLVEPSPGPSIARPGSAVLPLPTAPTPSSKPIPFPSALSTYTNYQQSYSPAPVHSSGDPSKMSQYDADQAIVAARDATLPRWPGPREILPGNPAPGGIPGSGWLGEGSINYTGGPDQWAHRMRVFMRALEGYKDSSDQRLAEVLEILPDTVDIPYLSYNHPLSFSRISALVSASRYTSLREFDLDMMRLFEKARRWFHDGSAEYGNVLALQRLYHALTSDYPLHVPESGVPDPSPTFFASIPVGPANARSLHEAAQELRAGAAEEQVGYGITTFRVGTKDRVFTEEARHKGQAYRLGDFIHLINPDDATRPIVGQIFKTFVPTKGVQTHHVSVCWYYRPEQTVHPADQMFYDREVFKTGQFCDHPVEDILERISVQFFVKYVRGRSREGEYYPGWPVYVCNSRFNHRDYNIVRIKNWNSCIPEELRQSDFMSIVPFERIIEPRMVPSPFTQGIQGPGFFGEPKKLLGGGGQDDEDDDEEEKGRRRTRTAINPPATPIAVPQAQSRIPPTSMPAYRPSPSAPAPTPRPMVKVLSQAQPPQPTKRTFAGLMGGQQAMDQAALREVLPPDTARLFPRDSRGQVLWFSGPPLVPGAIPIPQPQFHSIEYLAYLTKKKKAREV